MNLQPHQQRVVAEKAELDERLSKLVAFTNTPTFLNLPQVDRDLLVDQAGAMVAYSNVLGRRIAAWGAPHDR